MKTRDRKTVVGGVLIFGVFYYVWYKFTVAYIGWQYGFQFDNIAISIKYLISKALNFAGIHIARMEIPAELYFYVSNYFEYRIVNAWEFYKIVDYFSFSLSFKALPYLIPVFFAIAVFLALKLRKLIDDDKVKVKDVRGAQLTTEKYLVKEVQKAAGKEQVGLLAVPILIPRMYETRHVLIAGSTGTGKSVVLCQFINSVYQEKLIIYDRKGELFAKFGQEKDVLFNPYDSRFNGWTIFNEFELYEGLNRIPEGLVNLSNSLFSVASSDKNKAFYDGAASIFKSGCCYLKINQMTSNKDLCDFFNSGAGKIKTAISTLPTGLQEGMAFLLGEGDVVASFMSCLVEKTKSFQSLVGQDGTFSVRKWIKTKKKGRLFLSTAGENDTIYQPILTMLIDVIGSEIRAMEENPERRIYLFLDELSSLPPLKTLIMLLREGRSKGACCVLGTQTMSSIEGKYGKADTADIFGLCNSLIIFRTNEPGQSEYFSKALGNVERIKYRQSKGETQRGIWSKESNNTNTGESEQNITENLFLPGELQSLIIGQAIVKIAHFPVSKVQFANNKFKNVTQGFSKREMRLISEEELSKVRTVNLKDSDSTVETQKEAPKVKEEKRINTFDI